jgi:hypothetical protein
MKITTDTRFRPESDSHPSLVSFGEESVPVSPLDELIRQGAQRMLQAAIDAEVEEFLARHSHRRDDQGIPLLQGVKFTNGMIQDVA